MNTAPATVSKPYEAWTYSSATSPKAASVAQEASSGTGWLQQAIASFTHAERTGILCAVGVTLVCALAGVWHTVDKMGLVTLVRGVLKKKTQQLSNRASQ